MAVWKRLQRVGKKAAKFDFTVSYHELSLECTNAKWIPHKLAVNWTRRSRCIRTKHLDWVGCKEGSTEGYVDLRLPENVHGLITLYHDASSTQFDDKEWTFVVEKHEKGGRFKAIASQKVNMRDYAVLGAAPKRVRLTMKLNTDKYSNVVLVVSISAALVKEGMATDEDMQSIASLMSAGPSDVGNLADFDDEITDAGDGYTTSVGDGKDHTPVDSKAQTEAMSQLSALTAEISKFAFPEDVSRDQRGPVDSPPAATVRGHLKHVQSMIPTSGVLKHAALHGGLFQSASASTLGAGRSRDGSSTKHELSSTTAAPKVQAATASTGAWLAAAASESSFVERPFYAGTPPSTPPEERRAANIASQARAITPPPPAAEYPGHESSGPADLTGSPGDESGSWPRGGASVVHVNPSEDLLNWAKRITANYRNIKVTNFTTSWRNGLAFCAVLHHFRPDMIDYASLTQADVRGNNKLAFETGACLGIDKILEASDMMALKVPDKLQVMTYVHAMRNRLDPQLSAQRAEAAPGDRAVEQSTGASPPGAGCVSATVHSKPSVEMDETDRDLDEAIVCQVYGDELVRQRSVSAPKSPALIEPPATQPSATTMISTAAASTMPQGAFTTVGRAQGVVAATIVDSLASQPTVPPPQVDLSCRSYGATTAVDLPIARSHSPATFAKQCEPQPLQAGAATGQQAAKPLAKPVLMTRKQLLNPFDSDDEDDTAAVGPPITQAAAGPSGAVQPVTAETSAVASDCAAVARVSALVAEPQPGCPVVLPSAAQPLGLTAQNKSKQEELKERARQLIERARKDALKAEVVDSQGQRSAAGPVAAKQQVQERARRLLQQMSSEIGTRSYPSVGKAADSTVADQQEERGSSPPPSAVSRSSYVKEKGFQFYQFSRKEPDPSAAAAAHTASSALFSGHAFATPSAFADAALHNASEPVAGDDTAEEHSKRGSARLTRPRLSAALTDVAARLKDTTAAPAAAPAVVRNDGSAAPAPASGQSLLTDRKPSINSNGAASVHDLLDASEYVSEEMSALEKEQQRLDARASKLEVALRRAMDSGDEDREQELTRRWFMLVNRKHELIRRQAELNILNKEYDLERRYELLNRELRHMMAVEDWQKTQSQRHREALLLAELVTIVDKRDELVRALEEQQNNLEDDHEVEKAVHILPIPKEKSCSIQ